MTESFKLRNPTKDTHKAVIREHRDHKVEYVLKPGDEIDVPLKHFRGIFMVRCNVQSCRDLGYCTKAHAGNIEGGQVPAFSYEPQGE